MKLSGGVYGDVHGGVAGLGQWKVKGEYILMVFFCLFFFFFFTLQNAA